MEMTQNLRMQVRAFRDRRYVYKRKLKEWQKKSRDASKAGHVEGVVEGEYVARRVGHCVRTP